jgi:hypothetical protein
MEDLLELKEVCRRLPTHPSVPVVWRWITKGISGTRLQAQRYGRRWLVSPEALDAFSRALAAQTIARLNPPEAGPATPKPQKRTASKLERDLARAQREFDKPVHPCGSKCTCAK